MNKSTLKTFVFSILVSILLYAVLLAGCNKRIPSTEQNNAALEEIEFRQDYWGNSSDWL
ncbi:MAG: hypothetical protein AAF502_11985 [Bacteroidota bacterium]